MKAFIEDWGLVATLEGAYFISGRVIGHPHFKDGEGICTSLIVSACPDTESVVTLSGSVYTLGEANLEHEIVPDLKRQLFAGHFKGIRIIG